MLRKTLMLALSTAMLSSAIAQAQTMQPEKHSITVTGVAEREVTPDEIYMKIVLKERYDGRDKIEVATQERQMKSIFKELGIADTSFVLSDADQEYIKVKAFKKDAITTKTYELKVSSAAVASTVLEKLESMKITGASIERSDYSKKKQLEKELYMEAIRLAKDKATYVLDAIHESIGKPISVNVEESGGNYPPVYYKRAMATDGVQVESADEAPTEFKKIKFTCRINAEFAIK